MWWRFLIGLALWTFFIVAWTMEWGERKYLIGVALLMLFILPWETYFLLGPINRFFEWLDE